MTDPAALAEQDPLAAHAAEAGALLRELAQVGMDMARDLGRMARALSASAPQDEPPTPDQVSTAEGLMRAFARVSRSVRQSLALQAKLIADVTKSRERAADRAAPRLEAEAADLAARRARGRLRHAMAGEMARSAVEALEREPLETERLLDELEVRLAETTDGGRRDDADFAEIDVDTMALQLCEALKVDPGFDWWRTSWGMEHPPRLGRKRPAPAQAPP